MALVELKIYGKNNEIVKTLERVFIPWKILKKAVSLSENLDTENMSEKDVDSLAEIVLTVFEDQVTLEELDNGADLDDMLSVVTQIVTIASNKIKQANPIPPAKK